MAVWTVGHFLFQTGTRNPYFVGLVLRLLNEVTQADTKVV